METKTPYTIALTYNLKKGKPSLNEDDEAEFDTLETVCRIRSAIEKTGCRVILMEATRSIVQAIQSQPVDMVFNFAEGLKGRGRESQVPALLSLLSIPFTGSDETTLGVGLDKALSKRIVSTERIKTPRFQVFHTAGDPLRKTLRFPLIVKPNAEGSSKGILETSLAEDESQLRRLVSRILVQYEEPALVEEYIPGREFTVGLLGNGSAVEILPPMEILFHNSDTPFYSYRVKKHADVLIDYRCPADLDPALEKKIRKTALKIFSVLQCRDVARIDLRVSDRDGEPYFIEINPLPGLVDGYSDLTLIARAVGMDYDRLIRRILNEALCRHGMDPVGDPAF